ncbi:MAG: hypothetical protein V7606_3594 [Burkholderiales bacterium]
MAATTIEHLDDNLLAAELQLAPADLNEIEQCAPLAFRHCENGGHPAVFNKWNTRRFLCSIARSRRRPRR